MSRPKKLNYCIDCGKEISKDAKRCPKCAQFGENNHNRGNKHSISTRRKMSLSHGGKHPYKNHPRKFLQIREQIRQRDNYICQECSKNDFECNRALDVHCIDYDTQNIHSYNLIALCQNCHIKTKYNREYWKKHLQNKIQFKLKVFDFIEKTRV